MIIALLGLALSAGAPDPDVKIFDGRCDYPAEMGAQAPSEMRVACDSAILSSSGEDGMMIQFATKGGGTPDITGFAGKIDRNGDLTVQRLYLRPGSQTPATGGHCRMFLRGDTVTGLSCLGRAGGKTYVANFRSFAE